MERRTNMRYFRKNPWPVFVGAPLAILGFIQIYWNVLGHGFNNVATVIMVAGILLVAFFFIAVTKDHEIDSSIQKSIRDIPTNVEKKIEEHDKKAKAIDSYLGESFVYDGSITLFKKGRDGTVRTNKYSVTQIVPTSQKLFVYSKTLSVVSDDSAETFLSILYSKLDSIEIISDNFTLTSEKKTYTVSRSFFKIVTEGKEYLFPTHNDSLADDIIKKAMLRKEKIISEAE